VRSRLSRGRDQLRRLMDIDDERPAADGESVAAAPNRRARRGEAGRVAA